jgi:uridine kinase
MGEAYCILGPPHLIISDGLSFIVDRLLRGDNDSFVFVSDDEADNSDVYIIERLVEDLTEGADLLLSAVEEDQQSAHPRILQSSADHVRAICRRLAGQT